MNISDFVIPSGQTSLVVGMGTYMLPITVSLESTDNNRKIQLSTTNGRYYYDFPLDINETNYVSTIIAAPITNIKFIGAENDKITIISNDVLN